MGNKLRQCTWKKIVDMLSNPEGYLKVCYYDCNGYNKFCEYYTDSMKGVIKDDKLEVKTGLQKFFHRYPDYYIRSKN